MFHNVRVWTAGMSAPPKGRRDEVLILSNRIHSVAIGSKVDTAPAAGMQQRWVDGGGRVLMPGLIDGHAHLSFHDITRLEDAGDLPPEENLMWTQYNALAMLDAVRHSHLFHYHSFSHENSTNCCIPYRDSRAASRPPLRAYLFQSQCILPLPVFL